MRDSRPIALIRDARRIWAVGAVHGERERLAALHDRLDELLRPRDALVYLGDYLGYGPDVCGTVTELLDFRRRVLGRPPLWFPEDIVYLRGRQEEMWQKLLQLQFAGDPLSVLDWMLRHGVEATLEAYGGDPEGTRRSARSGPVALNKWTRNLREAVRRNPGHDTFMAALNRAAATEDGHILFVNCGVDPRRALDEQRDAFWWAGRGYDALEEPFAGFRRVVRGFDPAHRGFGEAAYKATVDGGCGFGGSLIAACLVPDGEIADRIEVA